MALAPLEARSETSFLRLTGTSWSAILAGAAVMLAMTLRWELDWA